MSGRAIGFAITLIAAFFLLRACANGAARVHEAQRAEAEKQAIEAERARTPDMIPPLAVRTIDPAAIAKAEKIPTEKHCHVLGKALRGKDSEFTRAMIQRTADLQLGVLHFAEQDTIKRRSIQIGMTPCMIIASFGRQPDRINSSVGSYGVHEQWVYGGVYVYFEDGVLTSFQY